MNPTPPIAPNTELEATPLSAAASGSASPEPLMVAFHALEMEIKQTADNIRFDADVLKNQTRTPQEMRVLVGKIKCRCGSLEKVSEARAIIYSLLGGK